MIVLFSSVLSFFQAAVPGEDSVYTEKIVELESRLSAQTAETQKLKVTCPRGMAAFLFSSFTRLLTLCFYIWHNFPFNTCSFFLSYPVFQGEVKTLLESKELMEKEHASATSTAAIMQAEKSKLQQEVQESKKEQDDLLMLLADQDQKILSLKQRLKDLGETVHSSQQCRT